MGVSFTYEECEPHENVVRPCKCCRFTQGVDLPIPRDLSKDELKVHARRFSHEIFRDQTKLNAILKRFESTIQKRWLKKGSKQRVEILLKAWPGMSLTHRPDFISFRELKKHISRSRTCASDAFLWPYINLEDLQQRHHLLLFMNSRGRNLPEMFVHADLEAAHLGTGWQVDGIDMKDAMYFMLMRSPKSYGTPIQVPDAKRADTAARGGQVIKWAEGRNLISLAYHRYHGLVILEIQAGIYSFLLNCAKLILHDVDRKQFFVAPHQPAPPTVQLESSEYPSLAAHALEVPYRVPQRINLDQMKSIITARLCAAEDHVWMLREDPAYFLTSLQDWRDHTISAVKHCCEDVWCDMAALMCAEAFSSFLLWHEIYDAVMWLPPIEQQINRANKNRMRLPYKEEVTWAILLEIIAYMLETQITLLSGSLPAAPRTRNHYSHERRDGRNYYNLKHNRSQAVQRIDRLFHAITYPDQRNMHGLNRLVQEVQYMLDTDPEANQLMDAWLTTQFSDLALLSELKLRIEGLEPWSKAWTAAGVNKSEACLVPMDKIMGMAASVSSAVMKACTHSEMLGDPLKKGRFDYPIGKRQTKETVKQMRKAEDSLDMFWWDIELQIKEEEGRRDLFGLFEDLCLQPRELYRTPLWKEPLCLPAVSTVPKPTPLTERHPNMWASNEANNKKYDLSIKHKAKVKTRGEANPCTSEPISMQHVEEQATAGAERPVTISVPKRVYKTFAAILPCSDSIAFAAKEIAWDDFTYAMNAIGLQPEKLYGSVWVFRPLTDDRAKVQVTRSISFHEPKEVRHGHKMPPNMVRTFGRRLKHAYGWQGGMFVCE